MPWHNRRGLHREHAHIGVHPQTGQIFGGLETGVIVGGVGNLIVYLGHHLEDLLGRVGRLVSVYFLQGVDFGGQLVKDVVGCGGGNLLCIC